MSQGGVLIVDDDLALLQALPQALRLQLGGVTRSEERRVGKECRSRW